MTTIQSVYKKELPKEYIQYLKDNPLGQEIVFNEYKEEDPDHDGRDWRIMTEEELLESWEMKDVGKARNFECLQLYVAVQQEHGYGESTDSNVGEINLKRVASGFVFGEENGDYLYFDSMDGNSVWIYYHDGGDVLRVANSFLDFVSK